MVTLTKFFHIKFFSAIKTNIKAAMMAVKTPVTPKNCVAFSAPENI